MPAEVCERPAVLEDAARTASKIRSMVTDVAEDKVRSARQAIQQGRYAAEDAVQEAKLTVRRRPLETLGVVFAVGVLAGGLLGWIGSRRR